VTMTSHSRGGSVGDVACSFHVSWTPSRRSMRSVNSRGCRKQFQGQTSSCHMFHRLRFGFGIAEFTMSGTVLGPVHTSNNVERFYCKISSSRQSRNKLGLNMFHLFRHCQKDEISFDIVAKNGNNVEATFDTVERIVQLVAFDNVASTLLLVWTGL